MHDNTTKDDDEPAEKSLSYNMEIAFQKQQNSSLSAFKCLPQLLALIIVAESYIEEKYAVNCTFYIAHGSHFFFFSLLQR